MSILAAYMLGKILHIAGTDTEIGKTTIACLLTSALIRRGVIPWVMKPIQTDCAPSGSGELIPSDAVALWEACGRRQTLEDIILYRYRSPVAPVVAAQAERIPIHYSKIVTALQDATVKAPLVIYEGTGGVLVPLTDDKTYLDLARDLAAETIVVVGSRLGAINHASLTFHALRSEGLPCLGYIFNDLFADEKAVDIVDDFPVDALRTNRKLLRKVAAGYGLKELAVVPRLGPTQDAGGALDSLADMVISHFALAEEGMMPAATLRAADESRETAKHLAKRPAS